VNIFTVQLLRDGNNIKNTTQSVMVGEQINLSVTAAPNLQSTHWSVPGRVFHDYIVAADFSSATVEPVTNEHLNANSIEFYWIDGGDSRKVSAGIVLTHPVLGARGYQISAKFDVTRPNTKVSTDTASANVLDVANADPLDFTRHVRLSMPSQRRPA
jgi:hypothetical protein